MTTTVPALVRACALGGLLASMSVLAACSPPGTDASGHGDPDVPLRVGPLNTQNTLTLAAASTRLEDTVRETGGAVSLGSPFPAFAPAAEAMAADRIDMTTGSSTSLVAALQGDPDLVVFAVEDNDNDTQGIVAAPGTGIDSVRDLAGRSVAINEGGTGEYLLRQALTQEGMSIDEVEPVHLPPAEAATAFAGGQIDAWATWDQYLVSAQNADGATLVTVAADIEATNPTVHVVARDFLDARPDLVRAAYRALEEQAEAVVAEPQLLARAYIEAGADPEIARQVAAKTPPSIGPADEQFRAELQHVADFYRQQGLTSSVTDVGDAVVDVAELP